MTIASQGLYVKEDLELCRRLMKLTPTSEASSEVGVATIIT